MIRDQTVLGVTRPVHEIDVGRHVVEHLGVAQSPVAEHEHGDRSVKQNPVGFGVELTIVHGWLAVPVDQGCCLDDVEVDERYQADDKQEWNEHAVHEGDKDLQKNLRIL